VGAAGQAESALAAVDVFREREARWDRIDRLGIGDEPVSRAPSGDHVFTFDDGRPRTPTRSENASSASTQRPVYHE
jgi:hypothetical protein